jgi:isopentenyldiphosphate isomerase
MGGGNYMEHELLKIFDENKQEIGVATRQEVHKVGHWHETFHCWFISTVKGITYIYFQLRSYKKKDFPNHFDITAAGHILSHESVNDGIREVEEELGVNVTITDIIPLGITKNIIKRDATHIDKEFCHVFLCTRSYNIDEFQLQEEEVAGIVKANFNEFKELWLGIRKEIKIEGFKMNEDREKLPIDTFVTKDDFVPLEDSYYQDVFEKISGKI